MRTLFPAQLVITRQIVWNGNANAEEHNLTALLQLTQLESLKFLNAPQDIVHLFLDKFRPICVVYGQVRRRPRHPVAVHSLGLGAAHSLGLGYGSFGAGNLGYDLGGYAALSELPNLTLALLLLLTGNCKF
ncbi:Hypothetical predicted protein [Cloeon dipterum]|uniref:Uncharacterized protein n=1 Tax=Cloeon dipterum TaxID=197152 RepID=A0A8S1E8Q3_9INSE|nr:Hypothetical predicted protein [Cloeon dipterum]